MHNCPECGQACYCSGDFEDHYIGESPDWCSHYLSDNCDEYHPESDWDEEDE